MDDILAKKNRHLFLEEKDNVGNSFIANVNNIVDDLDNIDAVANDLGRIDTVADNIDNVNTVAENMDDINTTVENLDKIDQFNDNLVGLLESLLEQLGEDGNAWLVRLTELGESILATTSAFNYAVTTTLEQDIASGATLTLPEAMKYRVGTHMLMVSWNGTVCYIGDQYNEVGSFGQWSTTITMNVPLKTGDKIQFRVVALADSTAFIGQIDSVIGNTSVVATGSTENRTLADRFSDIITVKDFGAKGDGLTDDTAAFEALEAVYSGFRVNLLGKTYNVGTVRPSGNFYFNGYFVLNNETIPAYETAGMSIYACWRPGEFTNYYNDNNYLQYFICNGTTMPEDVANSFGGTGISHLKNVIAIGNRAANSAIKNNVYLLDCVAIGSDAMGSGTLTSAAEHNIAIGDSALSNLTSGDRNIAIGSLALYGVTMGSENLAIGRDAGQCIQTGEANVCVGYRTMGDLAHIGLDGKIYNFFPKSISNVAAVGAYALQFLGIGDNYNVTAFGTRAAQHVKSAVRSIFIGTDCCRNNGYGFSFNNKELIIIESPGDAGTYITSESTITCTVSGHQAVVGCYVAIKFTSGVCSENTDESQYLYVTSVSGDTFTVTHDMGDFSGSGSCYVLQYEQSTDGPGTGYACTVIGSDALINVNRMEALTAIGTQSLDNDALEVATYTAALGDRIGRGLTSCSSDVLIGNNAGPSSGASAHDVFIGRNAGNALISNITDGYGNTAVGFNAMATMIDGTTEAEHIQNSTAIGNSSAVSGSNQIQLGSSGTTTYAYGAVQDRSDARDKADIRDTQLGLDFILALRPVDFRWDYRDDYIEIVQREVETIDKDGLHSINTVTNTIKHEKDGSRKRNRFHHGLIAQEVKAILDEQNIDFGGYQDHSIKGGKDILTLGYEEFIAPMIKAIQELNNQLQISNAKIEALMQRISALENNQ